MRRACPPISNSRGRVRRSFSIPMIPPARRCRWLLFGLPLLMALLAVLIIVYYRVSPSSSIFFPKCPFLLLTGMKCPGCGSQRAVHALLHADVISAFAHNALLVVSMPYVALLISIRIYNIIRPGTSLLPSIQSPFAIRAYFLLVLIFWITRNVFGF